MLGICVLINIEEIFEAEQDDFNLQTQAMIWLYAPRLIR
jgi:hypothetical protein